MTRKSTRSGGGGDRGSLPVLRADDGVEEDVVIAIVPVTAMP